MKSRPDFLREAMRISWNAKYTEHDVRLVFQLRAEGLSLRKISLYLEIPVRTIRAMLAGLDAVNASAMRAYYEQEGGKDGEKRT